jgi:hypothetical protein
MEIYLLIKQLIDLPEGCEGHYYIEVLVLISPANSS